MLNKSEMAKTAQLSDFDEALYKVTENEADPSTDKYLIATSEQPISAMVGACFTIERV
jgi:seryl-tRNA synthetase